MEKEILSDIGKIKSLFEYKRGMVVSEQFIVEVANNNPPELATKRQVAQFQDWLDNTNPTWYNGKKLSRGSGWGIYGPYTKSNWDNETVRKTYLEDLEAKKPKPPVNNTPPQPTVPPNTTTPDDSQKVIVLTKGVKM